MKLVGSAEQHARHFSYDASGSIASGSSPQLVLPETPSRSSLYFMNTSTATMYYGFGSARATCTISGGVVNSVTVTNPGFGFSRAVKVVFYGGGIYPQQGVYPANTSYVGGAGPSFPSPSNKATGMAVMTGAAPNMTLSSITITNGGTGYVVAPMVFIMNDDLDPNGAFDPSHGGGSGFILYPGQSLYEAHTVVTTDALAVYCATSTSTFVCRYTT